MYPPLPLLMKSGTTALVGGRISCTLGYTIFLTAQAQ